MPSTVKFFGVIQFSIILFAVVQHNVPSRIIELQRLFVAFLKYLAACFSPKIIFRAAMEGNFGDSAPLVTVRRVFL